jgi:hypothetical protein
LQVAISKPVFILSDVFTGNHQSSCCTKNYIDDNSIDDGKPELLFHRKKRIANQQYEAG